MKAVFITIMVVSSILTMVAQQKDSMMKQDQNSMTVMSYNIRYDNPGDGENAWPNRKDHVAEMMATVYEADVIGVQEALKNQLDDLQSRMPGYSWVGVGRDDGKNAGEFSPIFYNTERAELMATNTFWLSETPHRPGSKSWDAAITRVATWAKFRDRMNEEAFYVINTHFDHVGEVARVESAKMITQFVNDLEEGLPVIVTGDFNIPESSEAYSVLVESARLSDARYQSESGHAGPTASFSDWETLRPEESRIDYIFVSGEISVLTHHIAADRYDERFPSDHLPVVSEVTMD